MAKIDELLMDLITDAFSAGIEFGLAKPDRTNEWAAERRAMLLVRIMNALPSLDLTLIQVFVETVNARAEEEILRTGNITGAHHRAIEGEIKRLSAPPSTPPG